MGSRRARLPAFLAVAGLALAWAGLAVSVPAQTKRGGGRLVFAGGPSTTAHLYLVNADGSGLHQLTPTDPRLSEQEPCWSPNGRWIVYVGITPRRSELRVMRADGRRRRVLLKQAPGPVVALGPAWSPDGKRIAFGSARNPLGGWEIWTVGSSGGTPKQLTHTTRGTAGYPSWSPDSRRIAYAGESGAIFVTSATGGRPRKLLKPDKSRGEFEFGRPVWSPIGKWIAYTSLNRNRRKHEVRSIWVATPNGRAKRRLTSGHSDTPVSWSPRGDHLLFYRYDVVQKQMRPRGLFIVDLKTRRIVPVSGTEGGALPEPAGIRSRG